MKINFSDLISRNKRSKKVSYEYDMEPFHFEGDKISPVSKVMVSGELISIENIIEFNANIKCSLELKCSRCLDTFIYPIDIDIEERFTNDIELEENEEVTFVIGDVLDVTEIVESSIISTLPIKRLCTNECNGLCQNCGSNLNKTNCNCSTDDVDVRLAGLKALLDNKEV